MRSQPAASACARYSQAERGASSAVIKPRFALRQLDNPSTMYCVRRLAVLSSIVCFSTCCHACCCHASDATGATVRRCNSHRLCLCRAAPSAAKLCEVGRRATCVQRRRRHLPLPNSSSRLRAVTAAQKCTCSRRALVRRRRPAVAGAVASDPCGCVCFK